MAKKRKVNPNRMPASRAEANIALSKGVSGAFAIFFTALYDKEGYTQEGLVRVWNYVEEYAEDIGNGNLHLQDLLDTLEEETGIVITDSATYRGKNW